MFFGTPSFARDILEGLHARHRILALVTQLDKPFGRKKILKKPEAKELAIELGLDYFQPATSKEIPAILEAIESKAKIEAIIVVAYGKLLPAAVVENYLCINLHGSLLPYFRGASPVQHSIMADYQHFGLTVLAMDKGLDTGTILGAQAIAREEVEGLTIDSVFKALVAPGLRLLESVLDSIAGGNAIFTPQDESRASHCGKLGKQEGILDLDKARNCYLRYLALCDRGTSLRVGEALVKVKLAGYEDEGVYEKSGLILDIDSKKASFSISCKEGSLWIQELTPPNRSRMGALSFLQSLGLKVGDRLA